MRVQFKLATTPLSYYCSLKSYLTSLNDYQSLSLLCPLLLFLEVYLLCFYSICEILRFYRKGHQTIDDIFK